MKKLVTYSAVSAYLEKIFRDLNEDFFGGFLETPVITIQSTPGANGHFSVDSPWVQENVKKQQHEINISAETMARPIQNVVATMIHEMTHMYCDMCHIQDTSRGCTYHNKIFKQEAEKRGLVISYSKRYGWSLTQPSLDLVKYVLTDKQWTDILIYRDSPLSGKKTDKKPSSTRKYQCPCCGMSVRATKAVNILCGDCNEQMQVCS